MPLDNRRMPEIPELEAIRSFFNEHISGRQITRVDVRIPVVVRVPANELRETLPGDTFGEALRHGKFLLFPLASKRVLAINPMLTGRFQYVEPATRLRAKTCFVLGLDDDGGRDLRYSDERVMGKVYLVPAAQLELIPNWATNGPDLLDPAFTDDRWIAGMKKYRGQIKSILTKAEFVQGIGNAYADEILWEAQINPYTPKTKLSDDDLRLLVIYASFAAQAMANALLDEGIYVTGFFYPVVPQGQARIRTQMSAAHTRAQLDRAIAAFTKIGKQLGIIA